MTGSLIRAGVGWVVVFLNIVSAQAQQLPQYTLFPLNPYLFNPAITGTEDFMHFQAGFRSQWSGFEGAPQTTYLSFHTPMNKETIGYGNFKKFQQERWYSLGGSISNDKTGPIRQTALYGSIAYNLPISAAHNIRLSFGANVGLKNFSYNPEGYLKNIPNPADPIIQTAFSSIEPDLSFGLWIYNSRFFAGVSGHQLLNNVLRETEVPGTPEQSRLTRHYFAMFGYKIIIHKDLYVVPYALAKKAQIVSTGLEFSMRAVYLERYWVSTSFRNRESLSFSLGMLVSNKLEITYAYDALALPQRSAAWGSNEIMIGYRFYLKPKTICPDKFW